MCSLFRSSVLKQPSFLSLRAGSRTVVGCFLSQVFQAVPALYLVAKQHPVEMAAKKAASSLFSPSTEEENEREAITESNTVQVLDFEDERYAATVTMSEQIEKTPVPKVAAKAPPECSEGESQLQHFAESQGDAKEPRVVLIPRKSAQMPWLLKYCAEARVSNVKKAVLKRCKAKTRAKHYAKPDEHVTFSALEKAMGRKLAAHEAPKRSLWDHLECHRQACVAALEAPRRTGFNPVEALTEAEELDEGSLMIIIHAEKLMVTTVSKTAEFGTSAAALAGTDKAFRYRIPEPPKVPARKRLPTPPRRPQGEAPMTPPRTPRTSTTPRTPGTASKATSPVAAVEIESRASWQYQDMD